MTRGSAALLAASLISAGPALAQTTPAGTRIVNTATLSHAGSSSTGTVSSNTVMTQVDALIDVTITAAVDTRAVASGASDTAVVFVVTNTGNTRQAFAVAGASGAALPVAQDANGDGVYDPASDPLITTLDLEPGEQRTTFVLHPGSVTERIAVEATVTATTGQGAQGTIFPGAGPAGSDAVIGVSGGTALAQTVLLTDAGTPSLVKSQSVVAPNGSDRATAGSIITYELEARFTGPTRAVVVTDDVPAGTRFMAGSITLDGQPLSDTADGDAASFDGATVRVSLGNAAAGAVRTIRFQTIIN